MPDDLDVIENMIRGSIDVIQQTFGDNEIVDDLGSACLRLVDRIRTLEARVATLERARQGD